MTTRADGVVATRERIVRVASEMFLGHAFEDVTLNGIAAAAGVSHQTVLNHFGSKEGVAVAVGDVLRQEKNAVRYAVAPGDVQGAITALVGEYERIGDAQARFGAAWERHGTIGELMIEVRASHQRWIAAIFGDRLPDEPLARERVVRSLHVVTDAYAWRLLRRDLGIEREEAEAIMVGLVEAALGVGEADVGTKPG